MVPSRAKQAANVTFRKQTESEFAVMRASRRIGTIELRNGKWEAGSAIDAFFPGMFDDIESAQQYVLIALGDDVSDTAPVEKPAKKSGNAKPAPKPGKSADSHHRKVATVPNCKDCTSEQVGFSADDNYEYECRECGNKFNKRGVSSKELERREAGRIEADNAKREAEAKKAADKAAREAERAKIKAENDEKRARLKIEREAAAEVKAAAKIERDKAAEAKAAQRAQEKADREAARAAKQAELNPPLDGLVPEKTASKRKVATIALASVDGIDGGDPVTESMVESVRKHGILQPPLVRSIGATADGEQRYDVIAGKRRLQAARAVGLKSVEVVIETRGKDEINDEIAALVENLERRPNIIDQYRDVTKLIESGFTPLQIAKAVGMSYAAVRKIRNVGRLNPELLQAAEDGLMPKWAAENASRLDADDQAKLVETLREKGKITTEDVKPYIKASQSSKLADLGSALTEDVPVIFHDETPGATLDVVAGRVETALQVAQQLPEESDLVQQLRDVLSRAADLCELIQQEGFGVEEVGSDDDDPRGYEDEIEPEDGDADTDDEVSAA